jgi:hypothetical protein
MRKSILGEAMAEVGFLEITVGLTVTVPEIRIDQRLNYSWFR